MLLHGEQPNFAVFGEVSYADAIHAAAACVGLHLFPSQRQGGARIDLVYQTEPLAALNPSREGSEHLLAPDSAFGLVDRPQVLSRLLIRLRQN